MNGSYGANSTTVKYRPAERPVIVVLLPPVKAMEGSSSYEDAAFEIHQFLRRRADAERFLRSAESITRQTSRFGETL